MFCKFCGAELPTGATVCPSCQRPVENQNKYTSADNSSYDTNYAHGQNNQNYGQQPYNPYNNQGYNGNFNGQQPYNNPYNPQQYGYNPSGYQQYPPNNNYYAKANVGLCILSLLFPIAGIILFAIYKNERPHAAKVYLGWGVGSFAVQIVLGFISAMVQSSNPYYFYNSNTETTRFYYGIISEFFHNLILK